MGIFGVDGSDILARIPTKIDFFVGFRLLSQAPLGAIMDETPVFWVQIDGLELRNP